MNPTIEFQPFPKLARLNREIVITEKLDGTNAQVCILESGEILAGSRNRWITPEDDNYGFAAWVRTNEAELRKLGPGRHFGEWWGAGIQRTYNQTCKRFSLFNTNRWSDSPSGAIDLKSAASVPVSCCGVVPVVYRGPFSQRAIEDVLQELRDNGSFAANGFRNPEGIVVFHTAAQTAFKVTLENDEQPKSLVKHVS